jgi:hypothetical protein
MGSPTDPRPPAGAQPTVPAPDDQRGSIPTEENLPLVVGGRAQLVNMAKMVVAVLGIVVPSLIWAYGKIQDARLEAANKAQAAAEVGKQAKQASEAGFQVTKPYIENLEHRVSVLEAAAKRAQPAAHGTIRRPVPVVAPARPKPLPLDLNAAEAQVAKAGPPAQGPPPVAKPADAAGP